jgi:hypothetical protein
MRCALCCRAGVRAGFCGECVEPWTKADRVVDREVTEAESGSTAMALPVPAAPVWRKEMLREWHLTDRGLWWASLFIAGVVLVPVAASVVLVLMVDHHSRMAAETVPPSYSPLVVGFALTRMDRIAGQRGRSQAYLRQVAVDTVIACNRRHTAPTTATTRHLIEQVELLGVVLVSHAHFAYGAGPFRQTELTAEASRAGDAIEDKLNAVLRGDAGVGEVATEILRLLEALDVGDPLHLLPAGVSPTSRPRPVPGTPPIRAIAAYGLAVALGIGTIAVSARIGVDSRAVDLAAAALAPALALPPLLAFRRAAGAPASAPPPPSP